MTEPNMRYLYFVKKNQRWQLLMHRGKRNQVYKLFKTLPEAMEARDNAIFATHQEQVNGST